MPLVDEKDVPLDLGRPFGAAPPVDFGREDRAAEARAEAATAKRAASVKPTGPQSVGEFVSRVATDIKDSTSVAGVAVTGVASAAQQAYEWLEPALAPAFRRENSVGSLVEKERLGAGVTNDVQPGYSPWDDGIKGTKYEHFWDSDFVHSHNPTKTAMLKARIDREEQDNADLDAMGWRGTIARVGAGLTDPVNLIPVAGEVALAGKGVWRVARGVIAGARGAAVGAGIQEVALHESQLTRTTEESAIAVGGSVILGSLIGGVASGVMSRPQQLAAQDALERLHTDAAPTFPSARASLSAAETPELTAADLTIRGGLTRTIAEKTSALAPNLRANVSEVPYVRQVMQELNDTSLIQTGNARGITPGAAVETTIRRKIDTRTAAARDAHNTIYSEMIKSKGGGSPLSRLGLDLSAREDFEDAVGVAMFRGDEDENPFVARAAKSWRETVFDPWKHEAIEAGLLDPDISPEGALSYFSRVYKRDVMIAREGSIKAAVTAEWERVLPERHAEATAKLADNLAAIDEKLADLHLSPEERALTLADLDKQGDELDAAHPEAIERASQINELRHTEREARQGHDFQRADATAQEIERLKVEGGEDLAAYRSQRRALRAQRDRVDMNYAGTQGRTEAIMDSMADIQEANAKTGQRLIQRGRAFEQEMQRLDPVKLERKLSDLRSAFYDMVKRSEAAAERTAKAIEKLGEESPEAATRLRKAHQTELRRSEEMAKISDRLEAAEALDPHATIADIKAGVDIFVRDVSNVIEVRGEKAQRLVNRLRNLDPKRIDAQVAAYKAEKERLRQNYSEAWATIEDVGQGGSGYSEAAAQITDDWFNTTTGRTLRDSNLPAYAAAITRGPLKGRTNHMPDEFLHGLGILENNVIHVAERYARTMAAEVELTKRFGRADMRDQVAKLNEKFAELSAAVKVEAGAVETVAQSKRLAAIEKMRKNALEDLEASRDMHRGTYLAEANSTGFAKVVRAATAFNSIRSLGKVVVANLTEIYRPAMAHGLGRTMSAGVLPLLTNLKGLKVLAKDLRLAGVGTEHITQHRLISLGAIGDPLAKGTAVERFMQNSSRLGTLWNGLAHFTSATQLWAGAVTNNRLMDAVTKGGAKDVELLAHLGIDPHMAPQIAEQMAKHGGEVDGYRVPYIETWTNRNAADAYLDALNKAIHQQVVNPSVGDLPLSLNTPMGKLLSQYRRYTLAAHSRVMLRGMQDGPTQFISSMIGMTAFGMLAATLRAMGSGREHYESFLATAEANPAYLIGEGLDMTGIFALPMEISNTTDKLAQSQAGFSFNPIKAPIRALGGDAGGEDIRFASRGPWGALAGPSVGLIENAFSAAGGAANLARGEEASKQQKNAAASLVPFNSYVGMREMIQVLNDDSPYID